MSYRYTRTHKHVCIYVYMHVYCVYVFVYIYIISTTGSGKYKKSGTTAVASRLGDTYKLHGGTAGQIRKTSRVSIKAILGMFVMVAAV